MPSSVRVPLTISRVFTQVNFQTTRKRSGSHLNPRGQRASWLHSLLKYFIQQMQENKITKKINILEHNELFTSCKYILGSHIEATKYVKIFLRTSDM